MPPVEVGVKEIVPPPSQTAERPVMLAVAGKGVTEIAIESVAIPQLFITEK
jgi:hypothetical protein